ncbi:unnamed protein product [Rotaria magnacalcarata]|uniref:Uncharacterized protein n=3 Tax=Rotaria magnacalcarata TaxID=392030 RepID=A0A817A144_9BILA|nr:unnamed protein product [Rotaria magnacalcarata]CAF2236677.1 unnamed protein product [Rotaria magnacalcarata]
MLSSPLQTSSSTTIDDRTLKAYLSHNTNWSLEENGHIDHFNLSSSGHGDKFLNSSVHFPAEMRSANLNQMVSSIVDENSEYRDHDMMAAFFQHQTGWINGEQSEQPIHYVQHMKNISSQQMRHNSSSFSESGHPRNIPDLSSMHYNPPKDIQVLVRKGDHTGINSLIRNVSLQQFRQMIGLQRSAGLTAMNDRKNRYNNNLNQQTSSSSSSSASSSSSLPPSNIRLINAFKQKENKRLNHQWSQDSNSNKLILQQQQQQIYSRQHSSMPSYDTMSVINDGNLTTCQEISYFRSSRRTGVTNTLHIAIEKCYEQLNYIRDSYAETESKLGIRMLHKSASASILDVTNTNFLNLSNNPSRVDRLIVEYHYEYSRIILLHERIRECLSIRDIEATGETLDEWLNAINIVEDRRRQEIENATEKCRSGEPRLPDEKDVLQLADALRILRITTRKIRTVLWYWLYWSTNSTTNKNPLIARHQNEVKQYAVYDGIYTTINDEKSENLFYNELFDITESNEQQIMAFKKQSLTSNENNKENQFNE